MTEINLALDYNRIVINPKLCFSRKPEMKGFLKQRPSQTMRIFAGQ